MPEDNSDADGDIERMLRPELGNLQTKVTLIDHVLPHPADFISENKGIFPPRFRAEVIEHQRLCGLLGGNDRITLSLQPADGLEGVLDLLPSRSMENRCLKGEGVCENTFPRGEGGPRSGG